MTSVKDCFGRTIADSSKLEECRRCRDREACHSIQYGEAASSVSAPISPAASDKDSPS